MTNLKTLKDMKYDSNLPFEVKYYNGDIKLEAIKWVKYLETGDVDEVTSKYFPLIFDKFESQAEVNSVIGFIKHFFNITEEDLK